MYCNAIPRSLAILDMRMLRMLRRGHSTADRLILPLVPPILCHCGGERPRPLMSTALAKVRAKVHENNSIF